MRAGSMGIEGLIPEIFRVKDETKKKEIVTEEFISLFFKELVKTMDDTAEGIFGKGFASEVYRSLFETELARALARDSALKEAFLRQIDIAWKVKDSSYLSDKSIEGYRPSVFTKQSRQGGSDED